ncbi:unnamed protein product [Nesidiocoris tenuis]|uniref:IF140/IFT172/WDR19 TPR domain-containing protein n=1 Tax=Nesidiocoris tenuis TaxID=355587 RepID=A0A6H5HQA5_9HEMI|nr:unnamed protein product [Nesidiocoris tenuis]
MVGSIQGNERRARRGVEVLRRSGRLHVPCSYDVPFGRYGEGSADRGKHRRSGSLLLFGRALRGDGDAADGRPLLHEGYCVHKRHPTVQTWEHNVMLNDELAEKLSPEEGHENRNELLETLADCALAQANYHLATKKYTQAGNKVFQLIQYHILA